MEGENRLYTVLAIAGGFFCLAFALFLQSAPAAAIGAICFLLAVALWKYGYLIVPVLIRGANVVEVGTNFEIPPSQDLIVGKKGGNFLATAFLACRLYESSSEKSERQRTVAAEMFEKAVSSVGFPFKVSALVSRLDLNAELEELRSKRSVAESRKAMTGKVKDDAEAARLEREIAMWSRQIDTLTSGEKPLEVVFYLSTTASGITKDEAMGRARAQSDELTVVAGSALSCEVVRLRGEEMKKCFWWEFFTPADSDELHDEMF